MKATLILLFVVCTLFAFTALSFLVFFYPSEWALMLVAFAFTKVGCLCMLNFHLVQRIEKLEGAASNQSTVRQSI